MTGIFRAVLGSAIAFCALGGCSSSPAPAPAQPASGLLAIEHVTVVPMTPDGAVLADRTVTIKNGRITSIEPSSTAKLDGAFTRIDGAGKWLMPGLTDSHVHIENDRLLRLYLQQPNLPAGSIQSADIFLPYVANGVLQVVDLSAMSETVGQKIDIETGRTLGPHIAMAAMIDGSPAIWPVGMTRIATTPSDGRQAVRDAAAEGYEIIKAYGNLDLATFTAIVEEARRLKMPVVGHIPQRGKGITDKFFQPGFTMVAHAEEFAQQTSQPSEADIPAYVAMAKNNGTWLTATLSLNERLVEQTAHPETLKTRSEIGYLTPLFHSVVTEHNPYVAQASEKRIDYLSRVVAFNAKLVKAFDDAGIPVLAGTDTPVPGMVAGFSLHDELEAMARAGMSNRRVLEGATRLPAEWLGLSADRGVVDIGKRADLLLLDADPLANVANTRRISAVIVGGRYLPRADLDRDMLALQKRYAAARGATGGN